MNADVYCPNKFSYLKVDLEKRLLYNCHKAYPHQIKTEWLEKNPGKIFNTEIMIKERKEMLAGIRNQSCSYQCYKAEDRGSPSERSRALTNKKTIYTDVFSKVKTLDLMLNTDCRLSCVYCSGIFSSAWRNEIKKFGEYKNLKKNWNDIYDNISQKEKYNAPFVNLFLKEIALMDNLEEVIITGGEPLLYNNLKKIIDIVQEKNVKIKIITGLGVSPTRFNNFINLIKNYNNIKILISAEGLQQDFEFIRFGSSFLNFENYINILKKEKIKLGFICTISNLNILGLYNFYKKFSNYELSYNECNYPSFLQKHILDEQSKENLINLWKKHNDDFSFQVLKGLEKLPIKDEKEKLKMFLKEICERRNISLEHLPANFLNWLKI